MRTPLHIILFAVLLLPCMVVAMTFDNRFLPLIKKPLYHRCHTKNILTVQPFYFTGDHSWPPAEDLPGHLPLFAVDGCYDELVMDRSLQAAGITMKSLIPSNIRAAYTTLPWAMEGQLDAAGIAIEYYRELTRWWGVGASVLCGQIHSALELVFTARRSIIASADLRTLHEINGEIARLLGLESPLYNEASFGDIEVYTWLGTAWDYRFKVRHLDLGVKLGGIIPAAPPRDIYNPASISLGGDGYYGMYVDLSADLELKQDMRFGFDVRFTKRFERTLCRRFPVGLEPQNFGALTGPLTIDPGLTSSFYMYLALDDFSKGWGFFAMYTLMAHASDSIVDARPVKVPLASLQAVRAQSSWASEYVSLGVSYDFLPERESWQISPSVLFSWDIPVNGIITHRSGKTYGISAVFKADF